MTHLPTLLFTVESPFSKRDEQRFGISELSNYFNVVIADLSQISKPLISTSRQHDRIDDNYILQITSLDEMTEMFHAIDPAVLMNNIGVGQTRFHLFQLAAEKKVVTAEFQLGAIPSHLSRSRFSKVVQRVKQLPSLQSLPAAMIQRSKNRHWKGCLPDVFFRGGLQANGWHPLRGKTIVDVHSIDYEMSRNFVVNDSDSRECRVAYLDQDLGYHSDIDGLGLRHPVTPETFYPQINHFFDWLEKEQNCRVVICPHPRTTRAHTERRFPGRHISEELTGFEIRRCSAVVGHVSTAFSYAVISRKPTMILTNSEISRSWYAPYTQMFVSELAAPLVNLDDHASWVPLMVTPNQEQREAFARYEVNYLKSYDGPARKLWDMIGDDLLQRVNG